MTKVQINAGPLARAGMASGIVGTTRFVGIAGLGAPCWLWASDTRSTMPTRVVTPQHVAVTPGEQPEESRASRFRAGPA